MRPLLGAGARVAPRHGVQKPPRNRGIWLAVAAVALAVTAAAVLAGVKVAQQPSGRAPGQALPAEAGRSTVPEKWRELQEPLPQVVQTGKNEETIPFRARAAADPFAADRTIVPQQPAETVGPGPEAATPEAGPYEISQIAGAPPTTGAQCAAAEGGTPLEDEASGASGAGEVSVPPSSPSEAGASERVSAPQVADTPPAVYVPKETAMRDAGEAAPPKNSADAAGKDAQAAGPVHPPDAGGPEASSAATGLPETESARSPVPAAPSVSVEPTSATEGAGDKRDAGVPAVTVAQEPAAAAPARAAAGDGSGGAQRPQGASAAAQTQSRPVEPPPVLVTGIITSGDSAAYAIVRTARGSIIVRPGDEVEGAQVKAIGQKSVTVVKEGEEFVLELGGGSGR